MSALEWRLKNPTTGLWSLERSGIQVSEVIYCRDHGGYVDGRGVYLAKDFEGAREAVERNLQGKKVSPH